LGAIESVVLRAVAPVLLVELVAAALLAALIGLYFLLRVPSTRRAGIVTGLALGRLSGALGWVKRHFPLLVGASALVLGAFGVLLMFDELSRVSLHLQRWLTDAHLEWLVNLG